MQDTIELTYTFDTCSLTLVGSSKSSSDIRRTLKGFKAFDRAGSVVAVGVVVAESEAESITGFDGEDDRER